ncbi:protein of unknown function [Paraburkholderia kururiensis]
MNTETNKLRIQQTRIYRVWNKRAVAGAIASVPNGGIAASDGAPSAPQINCVHAYLTWLMCLLVLFTPTGSAMHN